MTERVFITGASGCVGHYLVEALLPHANLELFLLVRDRRKLRLDLSQRSGVTVLEGDMARIGEYRDLLSTMDCAISTAAAWGGDAVIPTNVTGTLELFAALNPDRCRRAIYFSTASILDNRNQLLPEAGTIGTDYIRSKYECLQKLEALPVRDRLISVFPTLVFGGAADKPYSHLSSGLDQIVKYFFLIRRLKTDGSFHFIHGSDIAQIVAHLATAPPEVLSQQIALTYPARLVLGMPRLTVNQAIADAANYLGRPIGWQLDLTPTLIRAIVKIFNLQMAEWDRFCMELRHFAYEVVTPETFGLISRYPTLADLLAEVAPKRG